MKCPFFSKMPVTHACIHAHTHARTHPPTISVVPLLCVCIVCPRGVSKLNRSPRYLARHADRYPGSLIDRLVTLLLRRKLPVIVICRCATFVTCALDVHLRECVIVNPMNIDHLDSYMYHVLYVGVLIRSIFGGVT
jgi:hypothetical protein